MKMSIFSLSLLVFFPLSVLASSIAYLPTYELNQERTALVSTLPQQFFLSSKKWNGSDLYMYHGTSLANAISIINTNEVIIDGNNNILVNGKGWYFFTALGFAMGYGSQGGSKVNDEGMVMPAKVKEKAVVLNWSEAAESQFFIKILVANGEYENPSPKKTFDELAKLGIDVIRWGPSSAEIIVLNKAAIELPRSITEIAKFYESIADGYEDKVVPPRNDPRILINRLVKASLNDSSAKSEFISCGKLFSL